MKASRTTTPNSRYFARLVGAPVTLAFALTGSVHADYQQTLAARGADAYAPTDVIAIEQEDLDESFSSSALVTQPALSDQEVMIDLQSRMDSANNLQQAAANLDPEAVADVLSDTQIASTAADSAQSGQQAASADSNPESADEQAASIASR